MSESPSLPHPGHRDQLRPAGRGLPLFYQLLLANLLVVLGGAVIGTSLTRQFVVAGTFTPWVHVLMVGAAIALSAALSALVLHAAFRQIRSLRGAIDRYRAGEPAVHAHVEPHGDPDIQAVAQALNSLWARLEEHQRQLERSHARLAEKNRQMQRLAGQVIAAQEEERHRVARELHDETMQSLAALILGLERGLQAMPAEIPRLREAHQLVTRLRNLAEETLENLRKLALDLRPSILDDHGLVAAIRWLARTQEQRHGLRVQVTVEGDQIEGRLPSPVETAIFRIVQEALSNVVKHARAREVHVRIALGDGLLTTEVQDDGIGIGSRFAGTATTVDNDGRGGDDLLLSGDERGERLGLFGMRERAALLGGRLSVGPRPDGQQGTSVRVTIPFVPDLPSVTPVEAAA